MRHKLHICHRARILIHMCWFLLYRYMIHSLKHICRHATNSVPFRTPNRRVGRLLCHRPVMSPSGHDTAGLMAVVRRQQCLEACCRCQQCGILYSNQYPRARHLKITECGNVPAREARWECPRCNFGCASRVWRKHKKSVCYRTINKLKAVSQAATVWNNMRYPTAGRNMCTHIPMCAFAIPSHPGLGPSFRERACRHIFQNTYMWKVAHICRYINRKSIYPYILARGLLIMHICCFSNISSVRIYISAYMLHICT